MKSQIIVHTRRIYLRTLTPTDVGSAYVDWLNDPEVNQFLEARFRRHDLVSVREYVANALQNPFVLHCGIFDRASGDHFGTVTFPKIEPQHSFAELSYVIGKKQYWRQGFGSEAVYAGCLMGFNNLGVRKIQAGCYESNLGSIGALTKIGFREEGRLRQRFTTALGKVEDHIWLGLLKNEFNLCPDWQP